MSVAEFSARQCRWTHKRCTRPLHAVVSIAYDTEYNIVRSIACRCTIIPGNHCDAQTITWNRYRIDSAVRTRCVVGIQTQTHYRTMRSCMCHANKNMALSVCVFCIIRTPFCRSPTTPTTNTTIITDKWCSTILASALSSSSSSSLLSLIVWTGQCLNVVNACESKHHRVIARCWSVFNWSYSNSREAITKNMNSNWGRVT